MKFLYYYQLLMLVSLTEAKKYAIEKVTEISGEDVTKEERDLIETGLEEDFFEKISGIINEEELEKARLISTEEVDGYLFHKFPNYTTLLEETTTAFLSEYLSE